ncbi:hypothetical protein TSUD_305620 [Trifolium subterraneum]|uniref:Cathepsin propeptide inhibitor domain-containing protein n=1 Tax=Trifolium subterraneum TaxID=3900 RepID=A0A2Z6MIV5_TRISU|nr:hypothetical protein TSUD_305620 [Trifolium subterraneum]
MKNPCYRHSQPPQERPRSDVLASPLSLHPKGENKSLKETLMAAALSLWRILCDWVDLIHLYINFEIWCRKYSITYPSLKEKLYRFTVFKKTFERTASMPNGYGDLTKDELEDRLPFGSYDDDGSEEEFYESLNKRAGNTYKVYEENNEVLVHCSGPNTFRDSDIEEQKFFERLRRDPGFTYQVFKKNNGSCWVRCLGNEFVAHYSSNERDCL